MKKISNRFNIKQLGGISLLIVMLVGCQTNEPNGARLYSGFNNYKQPISTDTPSAQQWFNQGMQLLYGFNHDEAIRSFEAASVADPGAAMAWLGIAQAKGIQKNLLRTG